jgi:methoxymalonate biosynthesis acyl carrier protein
LTTDIRADIRSFIAERFPQVDIRDDEDIFELGFVNSLFAMELVMFVENSIGCVIPNDELTLDNFRTVASMAAVVDRFTAKAVAG